MAESETLIYNRYSILHIERTSSFSKVFFALDTYQNPPRSCVIKVFEPIVQKLKIARWIEQEFQKEAKKLKQLSLNNPHLPEIYTYSSDFQVYYLVRELIEGETLSEKVRTKGKFTPPMVREILIKLLSVLDYIHQQGTIHQNIKPKNIILREEDDVPMLINFGSIKQIVSTYGFYGDKQIFSTNNSCGYAPAEQALGKAVPASDLYSLGLTAVYLLTAQNPVELPVNSKSNDFQLAEEIIALDPDLAVIITRAISSNWSDRYSSAAEMLSALSSYQPNPESSPVDSTFLSSHRHHIERNRDRSRINWWKRSAYIMGVLYIISAGIIAWYDWNLNRNPLLLQLPEPSTSLPSTTPQLPQPSRSVVKQPSILDERADSLEIPIFATGTSKEKLRETIGEPSAIQPGYWANSSAWIYKQQAGGSIDLGYLLDLDTDKIRQTEVAIAPTVDLGTTEEILDSLLQGNITPSIAEELQNIYRRQSSEYSFRLENLEGSIQRESDDHIYLGVWEADFH